MTTTSQKAIKTICGFCHTNCGLIATVKNGKLIQLAGDPDHPVNGGDECPKGLAGIQVVYAPDRLHFPLARTKGGFKKISWDEALDIISTRLLEIREKHGGETIIRGTGAPITEENRDAFSHMVTALGSNSYVGAGHICHQPRSIGFRTVCGRMPQPDYQNARLIIFWGANPLASRRYGEVGAGFACAYGRFTQIIPSAKSRGAKIIVIDPWQNKLAGLADTWLQIEPGTDDALALAMLNIIIEEKLYDRAFVEKWTLGFQPLAEHIKPFTPEWAEKQTTVKAKDIRHIARLYATTKPASIREGNALDQSTNAVHATRAIAMLEAITGNLDRKGGNIFLPFPRLTPGIQAPHVERLSADEYPLYPSVPFPAFVDAVFTGKPYTPRALFIHHANTLLIDANTQRTRQALEKLDFIVACDLFKTATTELAHIILPEASPFERYGFRGYASFNGGFFAFRNKTIEPVGQSRPAFEIEYELAKRMGLAEGFPFKNTEEWVTYRLKVSNVTFEDLKRKHIVYATPSMHYKKYLSDGFRTPSGKVELYSTHLKSHGYAPLPEFKECDAEFKNGLSFREQYPLIGTTRRSGYYTHTQFRNIPELRSMDPVCLLRIHPKDAAARGIKDGDDTQVESPNGQIRIQAHVTDEIAHGVILIDFGWGNPGDSGENVNELTSDKDRDPIAGSTSNHRFRCQVTKGTIMCADT